MSLNRETITFTQLAKTIDHSLLKPELTTADARAGCELAARYKVASVCVKPCHVALATELLRDTTVAVGTVVGFPHGSSATATKVFEARDAIANGAVELDMVINIGALRSGETAFVEQDIRAVCDEAKGHACVKVILENAYLTDAEKILACQLAERAGADFVKTSTGYAPTGATLDDLNLMRANVSPRVQLKAAHGIRTLDALLDVIEAGCTRVGATATAVMLDEFRVRYPERA